MLKVFGSLTLRHERYLGVSLLGDTIYNTKDVRYIIDEDLSRVYYRIGEDRTIDSDAFIPYNGYKLFGNNIIVTDYNVRLKIFDMNISKILLLLYDFKTRTGRTVYLVYTDEYIFDISHIYDLFPSMDIPKAKMTAEIKELINNNQEVDLYRLNIDIPIANK